jgi:lysyl-tRNA synthetase class 2
MMRTEGTPRLGHRPWLRRSVAAWTTSLAGMLTILTQLQVPGAPSLHGDEFVLPDVGPFERLLGVAGGVGMLLLARGMARGRRRAAEAGVAMLCVLAAARWLNGQGVADVGLDLAAAALLLSSRSAFPSRASSGGRTWSGAIALAAGAATYALHETVQLGRHGVTDVDRAVSLAGPVIRHAGHGLASGSWLLAPSGPVPLALDALVVLAIGAGGLWLHALVRPQPAASGHEAAEHARAADLVAWYGVDSLDPFALREDKSFHFAAGGCIAYRTLRETAVVSGDPIGPPGAAREILASFLSYARERGWQVVVTGASARHLDAARGLGLRALPIGEEAIVDPAAFTLEGRAIRKVRQSVTRVRRRGWSVEVVRGARLTPALVAELGAMESAWRDGRPRLQGFAMTLGRLWGAEEDERSLYVLARDPAGRLRSFLRFAEFARGLSLDAMRRWGDEPNGVNEALVVAALQHAQERGLREVSLNFAGFAHVMAADAVLSRSQRLLRWLLRRAHSRFQLERLMRFNAKFAPTWRTRYLYYETPSRLPRVALRVLQAEAYVRPPRERVLNPCWRPRSLPELVGVERAAG